MIADSVLAKASVPRRRSGRTVAFVVLVVLISALLTLQMNRYARDWGTVELRLAGEDKLLTLVSQFRNGLNEYRYLPFLISQSRDVQNLLRSASSHKITAVSRYLEQINLVAGSTALFVLDTYGNVQALSHWRDDTEAYRTQADQLYFQQAKKGLQGVSMSPDDEAAVYLSAPIYERQQFAGAAVVRIDLEQLRSGLPLHSEFVVSNQQEVLLAANSDWTGRALGDVLTAKELRQLSDGSSVELRNLPGRGDVLVQSVVLDDLGWTFTVITPLQSVISDSRTVANYTLAACVALFLLGLLLRERHLKNQSRQETRLALQQANDQLEHKVQQRTEALQEAQAELVQAEKLAALGRMSSVLVHELNQPLTAMRTYVSIARHRLLQLQGKEQESQDTAALQGNFDLIETLTERMSAMTRQLKVFAFKKPEQLAPIDPLQVLDQVVATMAGRCQKEAIQLEWQRPDFQVKVAADSPRLEQVFLNLMNNACDAMLSQAEGQKRLSLHMQTDADNRVSFTVRDTGPGFNDETAAHLFEPFFTTKSIGEGLGLGLAIVHSICRDLNGEIQAANTDTGAEFRVVLPLYEMV
ncbi:sensor histidine kinase [Aliamphritea ceti]|uniref:sensor histidine kinase n=1 Tax=Aliamphritea ceti TaxID=1524258 RepID=UPI0021C46741|nr:ATP-binding protein [Aliamphritea ceti]